ncbi:MAG TPA: enoyl-CoA hydratase-related protein [Caulobacterales bacterium]|nr:enoyl-CoA hydratase-related protein [Caulobacterales bacterium]
MTTPITVRTEGRIAFVTIDHPPVNGLSHSVRVGLYDAFTRITSDHEIDGVVLHGAGRAFSAGGDIREFGTPAASADPGLSLHVHPAMEFCGKTVVAAIHGYALGGGLETAMACAYRVATPDARLGLPEARLGVIPLSGTQRLPRLIGAEPAIDMILNAREVRACDAPSGLIDAIAETDALLDVAAGFARGPSRSLVRDLPYPADAARAFAQARTALAAGDYPPFAAHLLDAMQCGVDVDFEDGLSGARAVYDAVVNSPQSRAAQATFLARSPRHESRS